MLWKEFNRNSASQFACRILNEARTAGLVIENDSVDHVCYRVATIEEYAKICSHIVADDRHDLSGVLLVESEINGRMISTFKLNNPIAIEDQLIEAIEVPSPKEGKNYATGFEHLEVVTQLEFGSLEQLFPKLIFDRSGVEKAFNPELAWASKSGVIKFHHLPLSCVVAIENNLEVFSILITAGLLESIKKWLPICSGSIPLGVSVGRHRINLVLESSDLIACKEDLLSVLKTHGEVNVTSELNVSKNYFVIQLSRNNSIFEFCVSSEPRLSHKSHSALIAGWKLLVKHGESLRQAVIKEKLNGLTTEEAFGKSISYF